MDDVLKLGDKILYSAIQHIMFASSGGNLAIYVKIDNAFDEGLGMEGVIIRGVYDYYVKLGLSLGLEGKCSGDEMNINYRESGGNIHVTKEKPFGYYDKVFTLSIGIREE
jgi:hypothetical protein